jgi:hypothetical protein
MGIALVIPVGAVLRVERKRFFEKHKGAGRVIRFKRLKSRKMKIFSRDQWDKRTF